MNGTQYRKAQNEKQFPGCLGRMVNLFDLGNGVTGNRLLTDKPHNDGSSHPRSCLIVESTLNAHSGDQIGDKMSLSELRRCSSNKKANGTPMKTLLAQEMSKEVDSTRSPPNVVAKLMGLDSLPHQQHSAAERIHSKGISRCSFSQSGMPLECWKQDHSNLEKRMQSDGCMCEEQNDYRDVYEIWQQSEKTNVRDNSPQKGRPNERIDNANDRKMALVRQKFIEAKRLATDEKSRQSKEFQDALEVLSSNRDLFLKFLQEPHSLFSQHPYDMKSIPSPPETKRITVLRPSKAIDNDKFAGSWKMSDEQSRRSAQIDHATVWGKRNSGYSSTFSNQRFAEYAAPPTRIVVLKPSPGKTHDKEVVAPPSSSLMVLQGGEFFDGPEDEERQDSIEVAKEITAKLDTKGHRRDETLLSSVFSNGYIGDDSSFNKSDNEYTVGNLSDSEIMSPPSRHSWDYINRSSSPFSSSSFSRASCSPESSVCREAKKRLSERWAMMASNSNISEQKNVRRSSNTLGEMLALSDKKRTLKSEETATGKEQEPMGSTAYAIRNSSEEVGVVDSPKSLLRSRSLPVSSMVYSTGLNVDVSESEAGKTEISKELKKAKTTKSSLKGKVSSLFFSRNKKSNKENSGASHSKDESQSATSETPGSPIHFIRKSGDDASQCANNSDLEDCFSPVLSRPSCNGVPNFLVAPANQALVSKEVVTLVSKPVMARNISENQDQPSPISVLESPFEEDDSTVPELSAKINFRGAELPPTSNLIDKSPSIESIARTLSWDDSCVETATPSYSLKHSSTSLCAEEEQDWCLLIQTLLSEAGLDGNVRLDSFSARWHSPESPLDPTLRYKYANLNDKELMHEAKRRKRRSNRKLVFDCVNGALIEYESNRSTRGMACIETQNWLIQETSAMLLEHVWGQLKEWLFSEVRCGFEDNGDSSSLVVDSLVRKEVVGKGWSDNMRVELDNLGKEIEDKLLAELVEDAIVHLTTCV